MKFSVFPTCDGRNFFRKICSRKISSKKFVHENFSKKIVFMKSSKKKKEWKSDVNQPYGNPNLCIRFMSVDVNPICCSSSMEGGRREKDEELFFIPTLAIKSHSLSVATFTIFRSFFHTVDAKRKKKRDKKEKKEI